MAIAECCVGWASERPVFDCRRSNTCPKGFSRDALAHPVRQD